MDSFGVAKEIRNGKKRKEKKRKRRKDSMETGKLRQELVLEAIF